MGQTEFPIKVKFANGEFTILDSQVWKTYSVTTEKEVYDENWKDALAKNKPVIPTGTCFTKWGVSVNLYGNYVEVHYLGNHYRLRPGLCSISRRTS